MIKNFKVNNLVYLIISIFPILFITGPFLTDLFCIFLGLLFLIYNFRNNNFQKFFEDYKLYIYFFFIYYLYLNFNSFFSFNPKISLATSAPFIRIILFIFALALFLSKFKNLYKVFYISFFLSVCLLFTDSIIQFVFEVDIFRGKEVHVNRISSFFGDELIMGSYVSRLLPIVLAISFLTNINNKYFFNIIILCLSFFLIIFSGERLAAFYYIGIISIYFLLVKKYLLTFIVIIMISFTLGVFFKPNLIDRFYNNTISQLNEANSIYSYRHTLHYLTAYQMFLDKKFLGHGLKSFRYKCSEDRYQNFVSLKQKTDKENLIKNKKSHKYVDEFKNGCNTHPHNIYLENMSELGVFGLLFLIMIFFYSLIKFLKYFFQYIFIGNINDLNLARSLLLAGILLQLFPLVPSGSYFNNWMLIIFCLSIGFYLSLLKTR